MICSYCRELVFLRTNKLEVLIHVISCSHWHKMVDNDMKYAVLVKWFYFEELQRKNSGEQITKSSFHHYFLHTKCFPHPAYLRLKIFMQTNRTDRQLKGRKVVGRGKKSKIIFIHTILSIHWAREEQTKTKIYPSLYKLYQAVWQRKDLKQLFL